MVLFQELIRNLFLTLHGRNVHRQQRKLSKFLMLSVCSVLRCPDLWLQCSVSFVQPFPAATPSWKLAPRPRIKHEKRTAGSAWETWTVSAADVVRCARVRWEISFLLTLETAPFFCVYSVHISQWEELFLLFSYFETLVAVRETLIIAVFILTRNGTDWLYCCITCGAAKTLCLRCLC